VPEKKSQVKVEGTEKSKEVKDKIAHSFNTSKGQNLSKATGLYILFTITVYLTYHNNIKDR